RSVPPRQDGVRMHLRSTALLARDVADKGDDLDQLVDRDAVIVLSIPVEEAEHGAAERAEAGETAGRQALLLGEPLKAGDGLVPLVEHQRIGSLWSVVNQLRLHVRSLLRPVG